MRIKAKIRINFHASARSSNSFSIHFHVCGSGPKAELIFTHPRVHRINFQLIFTCSDQGQNPNELATCRAVSTVSDHLSRMCFDSHVWRMWNDFLYGLWCCRTAAAVASTKILLFWMPQDQVLRWQYEGEEGVACQGTAAGSSAYDVKDVY